MNALPFEPETLSVARARYLDAVADPVDLLAACDAVIAGRPVPRIVSADRAHVFDFEDGLRLVVCAESWPSGHTTISFAGMLAADRPAPELREFLSWTVRRFREISGFAGGTEQLVGWEGGVPRWIVVEEVS